MRLEIQALRAAAVSLVVIFHFWPQSLSGGFVGVDVFFVISGFLITAHLMREVDSTGRVALTRFWARRARRLLPASLLVLAVTAVTVVLYVPQRLWQEFLAQVTASVFYVENWFLAVNSTNYMVADGSESPVQHFWSLSVEEQFYVIWPLLIVAVLLATRRLAAPQRRTAIALALAAVVAASLLSSIMVTASQPDFAYFITPTRAWEFGLGGLLGLYFPKVMAGRHGLRTITSWSGWALIIVAAITFTASTPFPGWLASIPVMGALLVIWSGSPEHAWAPTPLTMFGPVPVLGNISYSLYLWHWPVLILAPYVLHRDIGNTTKIFLLAGVLLLSWLTMRFVEDPVRNAKSLNLRKPRWTLVPTLVAMSLVAAVAVAGSSVVQINLDLDDKAVMALDTASSECFGAKVWKLNPPLNQVDVCGELDQNNFVPELSAAKEERFSGSHPDCFADITGNAVDTCSFESANTGLRVALVGDSHAAMWFGAVENIAQKNNWQLTTYLKSACPFTSAVRVVDADNGWSCRNWGTAVRDELVQQKFDVVITSQLGEVSYVTTNGETSNATGEQGLVDQWQALNDVGTRVVVLRDIPRPDPEFLNCVDRAGSAGINSCAQSPEEGLDYFNPQLEAVAEFTPDEVAMVDMTGEFCTDEICPIVIGGALVYGDNNHMTQLFGTSMASELDDKFDELDLVPAR